jgi:hypothetical protein
MTDQGQEPVGDDEARSYLDLGVGLALLAVILVALLSRKIGPVAVLPVALGVVGLTIRFRPAPLLTLLMVAMMLYWEEGSDPAGRVVLTGAHAFSFSDFILSAALLGYFIVHYRLLGLAEGMVPADPRRASASSLQPGANSRVAPSAEIGRLVLSLPVWALGAYVAWRILPFFKPPIVDLAIRPWQGSLVTIALLVGIQAARALIGYARWRRLTHTEALLYLEDTLWQETRGEQRFVSRRLTRPERRKEDA